MDPITAFQVAASVITFVEFGRNILTEAREVYQSPSGIPSKVVQLGQVAKDLAAAGDRVSESLIKSAPNSSAASDEKLSRLCGECNTIKTFKTIWSQSKIDELDQQLRRIQSEMTMAVLMSLWKAGSGKSTLMKYIVHHASTIAHLSHWAGKSPVLFIYFYFWEATTQPLQYTQEGLLRTLLWQSFKTRPELIPVVAPHRWTAKFALHGLGGSSPEWTLDELEETFRNLASLNGSSFNLIMFINGLNEFDGEPEALVGWVKRAVEKFGIKVCVGSRPWTAFADGFEQHPSLTMQHLTASDIEAYVDGHFNTSPAFKQWQAISVKETEKLRQQFLIKADGVFLWVYVVVKDLMSALARGKSLKELHAILDALPVDVIKMYTKIYENLDPNEAATASRYLAVRLASAISLTTDVLWSIEEKTTAPPHDLYEPDLRDGIIERRLDSSTRGMLELSRGYIEFHHRSVREWLLLDDVSQLMDSRLPIDFNATILLLQEHIRGLGYYGSSRWGYFWPFMAEGVVESFWAAISIAFQYANMASGSAAVTQSMICMLDRFQHVLD
uniref:Nephrocystin 3-like N-terminal domain-containing protein n=1 Tax=Fusarium oxysporum (strain Fo5176) TaxID=660025 RepID=A0A0D2XJE7_FUSOF